MTTIRKLRCLSEPETLDLVSLANRPVSETLKSLGSKSAVIVEPQCAPRLDQ